MNTTYEVIESSGINVTVRYAKGDKTLDVCMDIPLGANAEDIINRASPEDYFDRLLNPVALDAQAALVGLSGAVVPVEPAEAVVPSDASGNKLVTFKDDL